MHYKRHVIAASLLPFLAAAAPSSPPSPPAVPRQEEQQQQNQPRLSSPSDPCDAVHVFIARGSTEPYPGRQGAVADSVCAASSSASCGYEDVVYAATFEDYCGSAAGGVAAAAAQLAAYAARCPDARLVLSGYSQGAHVLGDALGGGGGSVLGSCTQVSNDPLAPDAAPGNNVAAALFFGDVRHTGNQTYNTASGAARDGIYPRSGSQLESLNRYSGKLRSWCLADDPACAQGSDIEAHTAYFDMFVEEAAAWVKTKL